MDEFVLQESSGYMLPTLRFLAVFHTIISLLCLVGYYCLKVSVVTGAQRALRSRLTRDDGGSTHVTTPPPQVPVVVFKREKEIARQIEFDGLYITEQPSDDDIKGQWDRLVINTP